MSVDKADETQTRAIFFVFDGGIGLGHLRRLACIAKRLQGRFSCLIVTGHRAAAHWFIPDECEYIHLPSWLPAGGIAGKCQDSVLSVPERSAR